MYAFGPIPRQKRSGRVIGTHQKIDRVSRRHLQAYLEGELSFPKISKILHFEGSRGPDGIKMKSPGKDEPWHFIDPSAVSLDDSLLVAIRDHSTNLTRALVEGNEERAAFEAAWLAHAVTDGLTPAHHEPLDEQVKDLRATDHRKDQFRSRIIMSGDGSRAKFVENNWRYWGAKGVMTTHTLFEAGVAAAAKPLSFARATPRQHDIRRVKDDEFEVMYIEMIQKVDSLGMYEQFKADGWTRALGRQTVSTLLPVVIRAVTLAWYDAYARALREKKV